MVHVVELSPAAQEVEAETGNPCLSRKAAHDRLDAFAAGFDAGASRSNLIFAMAPSAKR